MSHTAVNAIAYHTHVVDVSFVETEGQRPTLTSFVFRNSLNVAITRPYAFRIPCCLGVVDELEDPGYGMLGLPVCANSTLPPHRHRYTDGRRTFGMDSVHPSHHLHPSLAGLTIHHILVEVRQYHPVPEDGDTTRMCAYLQTRILINHDEYVTYHPNAPRRLLY